MSPTAAPARQRNWTQIATWSAALLPAVLGLIFHVAGPRAQASSGKRDLPGLAFSQYLVAEEDGEVRPYYRAYYRFRNVGDKTVTITDLKPSCGCLNPQLQKRVYAPGERGEFEIRVDPTKEKPGRKEYTVDVHYEDSQPRVVHVTYRLVLPERKIEISPRALLFYQLASDNQETQQEVIVSDYRTRHFNVTGIESTSPLVRAELLDKHEDEAGNQHIKFQVTVAGTVPQGTSRAIVNISTDDPAFSTVQLPILIRGPDRAETDGELPVRPDPKSLVLVPRDNAKATGRVTLREIAPVPITIRSVRIVSANGEVLIGEVRPGETGPLERLRDLDVSLDVPAGVDELKALLVIELDSSQQPRIEIPIVVERRGNSTSGDGTAARRGKS